MVQYRPQLPFFYAFFAHKFLKMLYLNESQESVDLIDGVMLTDKTEHPNGKQFHFWDWLAGLTGAACETYKQRDKRGELRRLAATKNNQLNSSGRS